MGNGQVSRYRGGKRPQKYFSEDVWPSCEYTLKKLNIDEARSQISHLGLSVLSVSLSLSLSPSLSLSLSLFLSVSISVSVSLLPYL
jgi:hypothetical protein